MKTEMKRSILPTLAGGLLVSCQAPDGDPFCDPESMARFAQAAERGGAVGIRVNGPSDIRAVKRATSLPVLGIQKRNQDGKLLITPFFDDARELVRAGAEIIAVECTTRTRQWGALDLVRRIRAELNVPVMADIATLEEALAAEAAGADLVATTMRGYTAETESIRVFEPGFVAELCRYLKVPILAEGRVDTPDQAMEALKAGAFAVIVGTAITRPEAITARFASALVNGKRQFPDSSPVVIGIDLGGTNTKSAILSARDTLEHESAVPTPASGRDSLLKHVSDVARLKLEEARRDGIQIEALGIATAGWVDPTTGRIAYATQNLPGWTDTPLAEKLEEIVGLPVAVENDANALAIAERRFGLGRDAENFVCITLGTGIGGACYSGGRLLRGAHHLANAIGHIPIQLDGEPCSCGFKGCLEAYTNAVALVRFCEGQYSSAEAVIRAAHSGVSQARNALRKYSGYLATGIASIVHLLDPELVILAGGIAQENELLFSDLDELLPGKIMAAQARPLRIAPSRLGYYGAVYGAGAVAREKLHSARK